MTRGVESGSTPDGAVVCAGVAAGMDIGNAVGSVAIGREMAALTWRPGRDSTDGFRSSDFIRLNSRSRREAIALVAARDRAG